MKKITILVAFIFYLAGNAYAGSCDALWENLGNTIVKTVHFGEGTGDMVKMKSQDVDFYLAIGSAQWIGGSSCPTQGTARVKYTFILEDYWGEYPRDFSIPCEFDGVAADIPYFEFYTVSDEGERVSDEPCLKICCPAYGDCYDCPDGPPTFLKFIEGIEE